MLLENKEYVEERLASGDGDYIKIMDEMIEYKIHPENQENTNQVKWRMRISRLWLWPFAQMLLTMPLSFAVLELAKNAAIPTDILFFTMFGIGGIYLQSTHHLFGLVQTMFRYRSMEEIVEEMPEELIRAMAGYIHPQMLEKS